MPTSIGTTEILVLLFLLGVVVLVIWILRRVISHSGTKVCPHCAETIKTAANICRFCGRDV